MAELPNQWATKFLQHGRLKVKTSAQQLEEKRKERLKKLKLFRQASLVTFNKIKERLYDEEGLEVTKQILSANSDYSTMWNYRKNVFLHFKETKSSSDIQTLFKTELSFIESCLRNNPKSYGCWHHRCFVMLEMQEPDWKSELRLCDLYLQFDERNFHCWDYRKFVIKHSDVTPEQEIAFTNKLIERNFSNYSSWHYRSKLLPKVYPDADDCTRIKEEKLLEELELVQNAFFTDPSDQSAWFYHRWLLGRGEIQQNFVSLRVSRNPSTICCCLRRPVKAFDGILIVDGKVQDSHWRAATSDSPSHLWVHSGFSPLPEGQEVEVVCEFDGGRRQIECLLPAGAEESLECVTVTPRMFRDNASDAKLSVLQEELKSCSELNELEPGNKWVILSLVLLMRAIDSTNHRRAADEMLDCLREVDPKRARYYDDLQSKYVIEDNLTTTDFTQREVDFSGKRLTRLCYLEFFSCVTTLNISNNLLRNLNAPLRHLVCLKVLRASDNQISELSGLKDCLVLETLDLTNNRISGMNQLLVLRSCPSIKTAMLQGNSFAETECNALLPYLSKLNLDS